MGLHNEDIAAAFDKIAELLETGNIRALEKLRKQVPKGLRREFDTEALVPEQGEQVAFEGLGTAPAASAAQITEALR